MRTITSVVLMFLTVTILYFSLYGPHGLQQLSRVDKEVDDLKNKNRILEERIVETTNEIYALKNSDEVLEDRARTELGMTKSDEIVYLVPKHLQNNSGSQPNKNR